jgi:transposase
MATAPLPARITPGGSYGDGFIVDAALSKYCDLIPMERYCQMASRNGLVGLPPHSVIKATFKLADFFGGVYQRIKDEVLRAMILLADETPHKMLEGDPKKSWYLWGFSSETACFFECHDSRSGDVSSDVLKKSNCLVLVSDAYTGYIKSAREANKLRAERGLPLIRIAFCNSHARRRFYSGEKDSAKSVGADAKFMLDQYKAIYRLNDESKGLSDEEILAKRAEMKPYFEAMKAEALLKKDTYSSQSAMADGYEYFLKYYDGLTLFLENAPVPIDNNPSERLLRSPVVGRKTWYGTHSRKGARVAAVHFTIVESCKLVGVNPREYYPAMVERIHRKEDLLTPSEYKKIRTENTT